MADVKTAKDFVKRLNATLQSTAPTSVKSVETQEDNPDEAIIGEIMEEPKDEILVKFVCESAFFRSSTLSLI